MIFVTGGTGLIGSHLLYKLVSEGKQVRALRRRTASMAQVQKVFSCYDEHPEKQFALIEWVEGDILDYYRMEKVLKGAAEVYHCAAVVSFNPGDRRQMIRNNVVGTANIVNAALEKGVGKLCHVSSVSALSPPQDGSPADEQSNWIPSKRVTAYSESKFFSETEIWRGIEEGLDAVIVNPSVVLGPGNWNSGSPKFFKAIWDGMRFYPKGATGFVDVHDVVKAMILLMNDANFDRFKNQRFLLNAENWSYQRLFNAIAENLQKPKPSVHASPLMLGIAWRMAALYNRMAAKPLPITRETAASAGSSTAYDGSKITRLLNFSYRPVTDSIQETSSCLIKDMQELQP